MLRNGVRGGVIESTEAEDRRRQHEGAWTHSAMHRRRNPAHKENPYMKLNRVFVILAGVAALVFLVVSGTALAQTKTAQSAMFENSASGTFVITGGQVWEYNKDTAATYFTNELDTTVAPTVGCTGSGCAPGNPAWIPNYCPTPSSPSAPDPQDNQVNHVLGQNSCTFFDGGILTGDTYTQDTASISGDCSVCEPCNAGSGCGTSTACPTISGQKYKLTTKNASFKYTYTYDITPTTTDPVAPHTAWDLQSDSTAAAKVGVAGFFAGQSTQLKSATRSENWTFKASHTMLDSLGASRLVGATATITDASDAVICTLPIVTSVVSGQDFTYLGNAGRNGIVANLFDNGIAPNGTVNAIQGGVSVALNGKTDDFAGNNGTGGDKAVIDTGSTGTCSISTEGEYTLNVTGTLKGVSGSSSLAVAVSSSICISAESCHVCP